MRRHLTITVFAIGLICGCSYFPASAQVAPTPPPAAQSKGAAAQSKAAAAKDKRKQAQTRNATPVIVETEVIAPEIVTILHRLSGVKVMRLLRRSTEDPGSIAGFDDEFRMLKEIHTNVIAGLTLEDGETIAAWLPEAEAEMAPSALQYTPQAPVAPAPVAPVQNGPPGRPVAPMAMPKVASFYGLLEPDLKIVTRDGKRLLGHYLGLDGLTGLSVITLKGANLPQMVEAREPVKVGQRLRVIGPQPAPRPEFGAKHGIYVRVGKTDAVVSSVSK